MSLQTTLLAALVLICSSMQVLGQDSSGKDTFSMQDIFQLSYASNPLMDRSGGRVVYTRHSMDIMHDQRRANLWQIDIASGQQQPVTTGSVNVSSPALSPAGDRVAYIKEENDASQLYVNWLDSGRVAQLTSLPEAPGDLSWSPDGRWLAFSMLVRREPPTMGELPAKPEGAEWAPPPVVVDRTTYRRDGSGEKPYGFQHIFVLSADGGSLRQLTDGDFNHSGNIAWSAGSDALFISANRNSDWEINVVNTDIYRVDLDNGEILALTDRQGPDGSLTMSPDGKRLAFTGWDDTLMAYNINRLYIMNIDGSDRRELLPELDRSIRNPQWAIDGRRVFFQYDDQGKTVLAATDLKGEIEILAADLGGTSIGRPYTGASFAVGGKDVFAFTSGTTESPANISVGRRGRDNTKQLTALSNNMLAHRDLAKIEELELQSSVDDLAIQAWIAKPPGFDPKKQYPLIMEIHGGPHAAYGPHFAAEIQLFAAAGYVVVYGNPRGSSSYGEAFGNLIHHNYPSEDYDDLMSVIDATIELGFVDSERLFVTGGSGGGVLTAWIVGNTDRFRAAVVAKPVINWTSFVLTADNPAYFSRYWFES
ncbi:MAG: prolyl oligopeptidase family serine peptidase, partial [Pseudomonadota bacterium]